MKNFSLLDCTLRDGGYINDWKFGYDDIKSILERLTKANIDIIECGFLEDGFYDKDTSLFRDTDQIASLLPVPRGVSQYVAMIRFGHLAIDNLKPYDGNSISGLRITFHENEVKEAIEYCRLIQDKGYNVYVQPVGTTSYSDQYLLELITLVNSLKPYAFYIVDTLGLMKKNDLLRMFYLVDNNLSKEIRIGYHSHNNLQLAFSNAQELLNVQTKRNVIIDSSVHGMGRGAGNLNTELITQYLNTAKETAYQTDYLLEIVDETTNVILRKHTWGYSVPYYLAATNNCHPNYASYLMGRKTLPVKAISAILKNINADQREIYNENYIFELYKQFQEHHIDDANTLNRLKDRLQGKRILVIAPGKSVNSNLEIIGDYDKVNDVTITVNFDGNDFNVDYCFFSNSKRFSQYIGTQKAALRDKQYIITSNIQTEINRNFDIVNYSSLINSEKVASDNAMLMLISLLIQLNQKSIDIIGFDGYQLGVPGNYSDEILENILDDATVENLNTEIKRVVALYSQRIQLNFLTNSIYRPSIID
ncbi:aldolase catalytic domain-containing protein [Paenibacillus sp. PAMC21692]|uniref:aldolase catalytic domain-containing protein n=1 Tax=Paenibacillus sp. PAMC21692 TaxID=2762320 RepID=UPI00164CF5EC|nr:aldolase catalytic domain-containing protein [Paenibacillus sp. PAMC21692]QNK58374.1 aldolase catalytic domain-containing protein [Paenibacillus sp. PAMC21692]